MALAVCFTPRDCRYHSTTTLDSSQFTDHSSRIHLTSSYSITIYSNFRFAIISMTAGKMTPTMILAFRLLAIAGVVLLWGVSLANGTVKALILAVWHGELSNGISLRRSYTGFAPLDLLITLLVAFFFYGTNSTDEGYQLFLIDAYSTLQSAFVWLYVEATRPGGKSYWISR